MNTSQRLKRPSRRKTNLLNRFSGWMTTSYSHGLTHDIYAEDLEGDEDSEWEDERVDQTPWHE